MCGILRYIAAYSGMEKRSFVKKRFLSLGLKKVFLGFYVFLYEDQTRKYDPKAKAHEKHPVHGSPSPFHGLQHTKLQALL